MFRHVTRISSLTLLGALALGLGCGHHDADASDAEARLKLVPCGTSANEVKGCVSKTGGALRVIGPRASCFTTETTLCWSQTGRNSLVAVTELAAGDPLCAAGGSALSVGVDDDGDGVLEPAEVDDTAEVCRRSWTTPEARRATRWCGGTVSSRTRPLGSEYTTSRPPARPRSSTRRRRQAQ